MSSSNITKVPLSMIDAKGLADADVRFDGESVVVTSEGDERNLGSGFSSGVFDDTSGVLALTLIDGSVISVPGFMTKGTIGIGTPGPQGVQGIGGADGSDGQEGDAGEEGCAGPAGPPGIPGQKGNTGDIGDRGIQGDSGNQGYRGIPGVIQTYIQREDPGPVGAGAIWVKA